MKNDIIANNVDSLLGETNHEPRKKVVKERKNRHLVSKFLLMFIQMIVVLLSVFAILTIEHGGLSGSIDIFKDKAYRSNVLYIIVAFILLNIITKIYYKVEEKEFIEKTGNRVMLFMIIMLCGWIYYIAGRVNIYARPFALCAILTLFLINKKSAIFNNVLVGLVVLLFDSLSTEAAFQYTREMVISVFVTLISGIMGVYLLYKKTTRISVFLNGFLMAIPTFVCAIALEFSFDMDKMLSVGLASIISGILATSLMLILLPIFESLFRKNTPFRIAELINHKAKLIQDMQKHAPGTFNHSIIVANLVEACAEAIGEDSMLARACAYYHDIGKLKNSEYFTENQEAYNPHNDITPELSADIIKAHTRNGSELIHKLRLPEVFADVCTQHHGTMPIRYFYLKAKQYKEGELDITDFCYEGPKPQTKIAAIIMICDASEAMVRSQENRNHEKVDLSVKEIIEERMDLEQFTDCDITLKELNLIRQTIVNQLSGVYHSRVKYPKLIVGKKSE